MQHGHDRADPEGKESMIIVVGILVIVAACAGFVTGYVMGKRGKKVNGVIIALALLVGLLIWADLTK